MVLIGMSVLAGLNLDLCQFSAAACMGNVGPAFGAVGPPLQLRDYSDAGKLVLKRCFWEDWKYSLLVCLYSSGKNKKAREQILFLDGKRWYNTFRFQIRRRSPPTRLNKTGGIAKCSRQKKASCQYSFSSSPVYLLLVYLSPTFPPPVNNLGLPLTADLFPLSHYLYFRNVLTEVYGFQKPV